MITAIAVITDYDHDIRYQKLTLKYVSVPIHVVFGILSDALSVTVYNNKYIVLSDNIHNIMTFKTWEFSVLKKY